MLDHFNAQWPAKGTNLLALRSTELNTLSYGSLIYVRHLLLEDDSVVLKLVLAPLDKLYDGQMWSANPHTGVL